MARKPDIVSIAEIHERTGFHRDTIKAWIRAGKFPGYMPGPKTYIVTRVAYERWLAGDWQPQVAQSEPLRIVKEVA